MVMEKLQHALAVVLEKIGNVGGALQSEQRAIAHLHKVWLRARKKSERLSKEADQLRRAHHPKKARRAEQRAHRQHVKAERVKLAAQPHIKEAKRLARRLHGLETTEAEVRAQLRQLRNDHGVTVSGNHASGGTRRQRVVAVALASVAACSSGKRSNRYKQDGYWDVDHVVTGEPYAARSDCSQWLLAVCKGAGIPDPTKRRYANGFTGTILDAKPISRSNLKPACAVVYGDYDGFHTELYIGPGQRTAGHGSPPIDFGIIDLVPGATTRFRDLVG